MSNTNTTIENKCDFTLEKELGGSLMSNITLSRDRCCFLEFAEDLATLVVAPLMQFSVAEGIPTSINRSP